jgi:4-hydroxybutyrate dehydrogenase
MIEKKHSFNFPFPGPIILGSGAVEQVGEEMRKLGGSRILLVTGPHVEDAGLLVGVLDSLEKANLKYLLFKDAQQNPTDENVYRGVDGYFSYDCDSVIALGGGSRIDTAKAIRLLATHKGKLDKYYMDAGGMKFITSHMPPLISIPTTAGSGSETSRGTIITDTKLNRKRLIAGPGITSTLSILDPMLTVSMSPELTATTGIDAFSHALETYVGTNYNPFAEGLSRHAASIIHTALPKAYKEGEDLDARMQMITASAMAAVGFSKGLGIVHSLAHQLSTVANLSHGLAISIMLPYGMAFNLNAAKRGYADLAMSMKLVSMDASDEDCAKTLIDTVRQLCLELNLPQKLSTVGIDHETLPRMAKMAMLDHCHLTNPQKCTEDDMLAVFEQAF